MKKGDFIVTCNTCYTGIATLFNGNLGHAGGSTLGSMRNINRNFSLCSCMKTLCVINPRVHVVVAAQVFQKATCIIYLQPAINDLPEFGP